MCHLNRLYIDISNKNMENRSNIPDFEFNFKLLKEINFAIIVSRFFFHYSTLYKRILMHRSHSSSFFGKCVHILCDKGGRMFRNVVLWRRVDNWGIYENCKGHPLKDRAWPFELDFILNINTEQRSFKYFIGNYMVVFILEKVRNSVE